MTHATENAHGETDILWYPATGTPASTNGDILEEPVTENMMETKMSALKADIDREKTARLEMEATITANELLIASLREQSEAIKSGNATVERGEEFHTVKVRNKKGKDIYLFVPVEPSARWLSIPDNGQTCQRPEKQSRRHSSS